MKTGVLHGKENVFWNKNIELCRVGSATSHSLDRENIGRK